MLRLVSWKYFLLCRPNQEPRFSLIKLPVAVAASTAMTTMHDLKLNLYQLVFTVFEYGIGMTVS